MNVTEGRTYRTKCHNTIVSEKTKMNEEEHWIWEEIKWKWTLDGHSYCWLAALVYLFVLILLNTFDNSFSSQYSMFFCNIHSSFNYSYFLSLFCDYSSFFFPVYYHFFIQCLFMLGLTSIWSFSDDSLDSCQYMCIPISESRQKLSLIDKRIAVIEAVIFVDHRQMPGSNKPICTLTHFLTAFSRKRMREKKMKQFLSNFFVPSYHSESNQQIPASQFTRGRTVEITRLKS